MCMVLYGYDASTYNSVQASDNWLAWFNLSTDDSYTLGLINTIYSIGAIISGWFCGGPVVSTSNLSALQHTEIFAQLLTLRCRPITSDVDGAWLLVVSSLSAQHSCNASLRTTTWVASWLVVSSWVSARAWL